MRNLLTLYFLSPDNSRRRSAPTDGSALSDLSACLMLRFKSGGKWRTISATWGGISGRYTATISSDVCAQREVRQTQLRRIPLVALWHRNSCSERSASSIPDRSKHLAYLSTAHTRCN